MTRGCSTGVQGSCDTEPIAGVGDVGSQPSGLNVVKGLAKLLDETVIDGEVIALDDDNRPSFNILQNYTSRLAFG